MSAREASPALVYLSSWRRPTRRAPARQVLYTCVTSRPNSASARPPAVQLSGPRLDPALSGPRPAPACCPASNKRSAPRPASNKGPRPAPPATSGPRPAPPATSGPRVVRVLTRAVPRSPPRPASSPHRCGPDQQSESATSASSESAVSACPSQHCPLWFFVTPPPPPTQPPPPPPPPPPPHE